MNLRLFQRPQLSRAARLRFDAVTASYVLLSPERGLRLNASASQILQRCNGHLTVLEIVGELLELGTFERAVSSARVTEDVLHLLRALHSRRLLVFERAQ